MDEMTFQKCWAAAGAERSALAHVVESLKRRAGALYVRGEDKQAELVRTIALELDKERAEASDVLDLYIRVSCKRP